MPGTNASEMLDVVVSCAKECGRERVLLYQAQKRHDNQPRGYKRETARALRDQRKVYDAAEQRLARAREAYERLLSA